ncbi:hypothetical protein HBH92_172740 [Parastagonospora nodorum]|nr:hypothetical protein HBH92_172740 [Parastagonospora nodorum]KAH4447777.1 hypothetical protein HBH93_052250 [Parastagonospora nodorum]KAH4460349.1 hypothetical protein HBH91_071370 [Parastagonospora nodorum]KAH4497036.1 hypothetical protein HBH89_139540 [Parastagonospora nodorum]KAH4535227.1 hypothetical protein HBH85_162890 [Parastagonospora nodorum]
MSHKYPNGVIKVKLEPVAAKGGPVPKPSAPDRNLPLGLSCDPKTIPAVKVQECGSAPSFVLGRPSQLFISRGPARICERRTDTRYPAEVVQRAEVAARRRYTCRNLHVAPERDELGG